MVEALQKELENMMKSPDTIAVALIYNLLKPVVMSQLGLSSGEQPQQQALPQPQAPQEQQEQQTQHTIPIPIQQPTQK